jgi:hypothetical protein
MRAAIAEGLRGGESLTFVDEDDSRDTDELDVDGGIAINVGGVRVNLTAEDKDAVANDVELLM